MVPMHPHPETGWIYDPEAQPLCHISGLDHPLRLQLRLRAGSESTVKQAIFEVFKNGLFFGYQ